MKKTALLFGVCLMAISATAYTNYTGPEDRPHVMDSDTNLSLPKAITQNGTDWKSKVKIVGRLSNASIGNSINSSFSGKKTDFSGYIRAATPCHVIDQETERTGEKTYRMNLKTVNPESSQTCVQQAVTLKYNGSFQADEPFKLSINHGNQSVKTLEHPDYVGQDEWSGPAPVEQENEGPIESLIDWISDFFSDEPEVKSIESEDLEGIKVGDGGGDIEIKN
ncbi:MAG: hypothetical protein H8Z69_06040 [Nanohaloarchaea archaeon]|nr:hypothetical protein [Candidatus Nanohaloarchaea archaeon]